MQDLEIIANISKNFIKYRNVNIKKISPEELNTISEDLTNYLIMVTSVDENLIRVRKEFSEKKFCDNQVNIMHIVAKFGDQDQLKNLIELVGIENIDIRDSDLFTPLHHAAISGVFENAVILMNSGAKLNLKSSDETRNWLPIHYAARSGSLELVTEFINRGVDIKEETSFGLNPLHVACEFGHDSVVQHLIKIGANVNSTTNYDNHRMSPLHYGVLGNYFDVVKTLLNSGAERNKIADNGFSVLDISVSKDYQEMTEYLLQQGVKSYENAFEIAKQRGNLKLMEILEKYRNARENIFNVLELKKISGYLEEVLKKYDSNNLEEVKINLPNNVGLSAFGILSFSKKVGFIKKSEISLIQFAEKNGLIELAKVLRNVQSIIDSKRL